MKKVLLVLAVGFLMTSCYTHKHVVGKGSQTGKTTSKKQHNFIYGLASGETPSAKEITGKDLKDYEVTTEHSFIDGLISGLTSGIYNPTTVTIKEK